MSHKFNLALFFVLFFILPFCAFAQHKYTVSGKVIDHDENFPLEYATITFIDETGQQADQGGITDGKGNFSIDISQGTYTIKVEYISFKPKEFKNRNILKNTNLGTIGLSVNSNSLDEVVVTAETTEVEVKLDKKVYNIGKDLTTQGATVSDALSNVPSVTVDVEGAVSLRGNENVKILINGKPSAMAGFGNTDVFQQLPADAIERVEVITSPSARYDAEGTAGILNIILKKEKTLGFNGSFSGNIGYPASSGFSANLNYRTDRYNLFTTTGVYYRKSPGNAYFDNRYNSGTYSKIIEDREYDRLRKGINSNIGMEYYLNDHSSITGSFFMRFGDDKDINQNNTIRYLAGSNDYEKTLREEIEKEDDNSYQGALNYTNNIDEEGQKLTAQLQYSYDDEKQPSYITENIYFPTEVLLDKENILENETEKEFLAQVDYVLPMGDAQFEAGYRGNFEETVNDYQLDTLNMGTGNFQRDLGNSNIFTYTENINAVYSQYGNKLGDFSFLLGLRLEQTQLKGKVDPYAEDGVDLAFDADFDKNYLSLFPTANLTYEFNDSENITLGYNRRINRPRGFYINPFPSRSSTTNIFQGNPDLDPSFSDAFDLGYLKKWKEVTLTTSVYYQHETGAFERVNDDNNQEINGVIANIITPINLSSEDRYGAEAGLLYNPTKWLKLNGSFNFFRSVSEGSYNGRDYGAENTSWFGRFSSKVSLPWKIDWQTNAYYRGPRKNAQTETKALFSMNLALSKELIENKLTASFNVSDVFNSRKRDSFTITDNYTSDSEFQWRERQFNLSLIYRFNQPKETRKRQENQDGGFGGDDDGFGG